ncbi:MAG TPA: FtsX-like permease family protein [Bryobacteraceae bacterium]|nr:FtsX-like permease family protein [Bryobacteraceae bacterium]
MGDVLTDLDKSPEPTMYLPLLDAADYDAVFVMLHTSVEPHAVISAVRQQIGRVDPELAVDEIRTMDELAGMSASDRQFSMMLFGSFAALALLLAAAGLYAVLSYTVSQRKGEIGIRMALGASNSDVSGWVLQQGLKPALAGVVAGLIVAALAVRVLKSLLFGVDPFDPLTFALLPILLLCVAALACYLPALRATRIDPTVTLRME